MSVLLQILQITFLVLGTIAYIITSIVKSTKTKKTKITKEKIKLLLIEIDKYYKKKSTLITMQENTENEITKNYFKDQIIELDTELSKLETEKTNLQTRLGE